MRKENSRILASNVLILDDDRSNALFMQRLLEASGYSSVYVLNDPTQALEYCLDHRLDLILLDLHMPRIDGYAILSQLREDVQIADQVPILVLTADVNPEAKKRALSLGANDFLTKPGDASEIILRIRNLLEMRLLQSELRQQNDILEKRVSERTRDLECARLEVLEKLAKAAEFRDDDTGEHTRRVGDLAARIAERIGSQDAPSELIRLAAPLHDVGKIGIPDAILLKPGKLSPEEFEIMKTHTTIGADILSGSESNVLNMAEVIAKTHHEKWNGSGYPGGLQGKLIPLAGRIVSVADVFDALTNERPYKSAWPVEDAIREIRCLSGVHFDPEVVAAMLSLRIAARLVA